MYVPTWEKLSSGWEQIVPPWRPSKDEITFWEKKILELKKQNPELKVLITGSTPEIRDMLQKHDIDTTLLDADESMYKAMSRFVKEENKKEKIVFGNWLEADKLFPNDSFDVVMGDEPHCNLAYTDWPLFFKGIHNILKPKGYLLLSTIVSDLSKKLTIDDVLKKYKENPGFFDSMQNKIWLYYQLFNDSDIFDESKREFSFNNLRKKIIKEGTDAGLKTSDLSKLWFFENDLNGETFGFDLVEVDPSFEEQQKIMDELFVLKNMFHDKSHPAFSIKRVMILESKKN